MSEQLPQKDQLPSTALDELANGQAASEAYTEFPETNRDIAREAQRTMALGIREKPAVLSVIQTVRQTPELWNDVGPVVRRSGEFKASAVERGDTHRTLTGLFVGMAMSERAGSLLDIAIDRTVDAESAKIKEVLRSGEAHVHTLVIGSGPQAAIYNSEKMAHDPLHPALTVEADKRIGGQFAQPRDAVWELNTRTRPNTGEDPHVPGRHGSINNMPHGPIQQADLASQVYGSQEGLAKAIKTNHLLVSKVVNKTSLVGFHEVPSEVAGEPPLTTAEFADAETGEHYMVTYDRAVLSTGLGEEKTGLENADETTLQILAEEKAKLERGEDAQVMTYGDFAGRVGEVDDPFPLRGWKKVGIVSPMDSGKVAAKYVLGHGGDRRKSTAQLDYVEDLLWIGQKAESREDFVSDPAVRLVYKGLGLEMPLESDSEYAHRITPDGGRAHRLERHGDMIRVFITDKGSEVERFYDLDHLVLATGFTENSDKYLPEGHTESELVYGEDGQPIARKITGTQIYKVGPSAQLPLSEKQISESPAMKAKKLNTTVAIWATSDHTAALARQHAAEDYAANPEPDVASAKWDRVETDLTEVNKAIITDKPVNFSFDKKHIQKGINPAVTNEDLLKLATGDTWSGYRFPDNLEAIALQVGYEESDDSDKLSVEVRSDTIPLEDTSYKEAVAKLMADPVFEAALVNLTSKNANSSQKAEVVIPLFNRKVDVGGVAARVVRQRARASR